MKERAILFSASMVRALLAGTKTQTRRAVKGAALEWLQPGMFTPAYVADPANSLCPYGVTGDRLWVRESFSGPYHQERHPPRDWHSTDPIHYWADGNPLQGDWTKPRPGMFMPRWASRITLEVTEVRVERLQDISPDDAEAEGLKGITKDGKLVKYGIPDADGLPGADNTGWPWHEWRISPVDAYQRVWESINGPGSWDANPWVWAVSFRRIHG